MSFTREISSTLFISRKSICSSSSTPSLTLQPYDIDVYTCIVVAYMYVQWSSDTLGWIIVAIIERLSSFRGKNVLPLYRLVHQKVPFKQRFHCITDNALHCKYPLYLSRGRGLSACTPLPEFRRETVFDLHLRVTQSCDYTRGLISTCTCMFMTVMYIVYSKMEKPS